MNAMKNIFLPIIFIVAYLFLPPFCAKSKIFHSRDFKNTMKFCGSITFVGGRYLRGGKYSSRGLVYAVVDLNGGNVSKTFFLPTFVDDSEIVLKHKKGDNLCLIYGVSDDGDHELIKIV